MSWGELERTKVPSRFIKLKDGDTIEGVFRGEPYIFYRIYKDKTEYRTYIPGSKFRFRVNFVTRENGNVVAKIFEGGSKIRDAILEAKEEYGLNYVFKIKRKGSGMNDTTYSIFPKEPLNESAIEAINAVKLNDLEPKQSSDNHSSYQDEEDVPFE